MEEKVTNCTVIEYVKIPSVQLESEKIWGDIQRPLPDYLGLEKWNYFHTHLDAIQ